MVQKLPEYAPNKNDPHSFLFNLKNSYVIEHLFEIMLGGDEGTQIPKRLGESGIYAKHEPLVSS